MSLWLTIPFALGIIAALIAVIKSRSSNVTALHIDH